VSFAGNFILGQASPGVKRMASDVIVGRQKSDMKVFKREKIQTHCVGQEWPEYLGSVQLGESFIIETEQ